MPKHPPARARRWQATLIITLFFVAVASAAAIGWWYAREAPPHQGPIVLIAADDLAPSALVPSSARAATPAIDALLADSVVFDRAYAHSPLLLPSDVSILSGELPYEHGVRDDGGFTLAPNVRTMAELLRGRGFETGAAVSSYLLRRDSGVGQGFSFFDAAFQPADDHTPTAGRPGTATIDAAEQWARSKSDQRYFLFVQVPADDADAAVARLTGLLKQRRLYAKATIILVGARGRSAARIDPEAYRVPLAIKQPDREGAGRHVTGVVQQVDLLPTVLDFVRAPLPGGLHGRSLRAAIDGSAPLAGEPVYAESMEAYYRFGGPPLYALWTDQAIARWGAPGTAATQPATDALRKTLDQMVTRHAPAAPAPVPESDEDALALTGYLAGLPPAPDARDDDPPATLDASMLQQHRAAAMAAGHRNYPEAVHLLQSMAKTLPTSGSLAYQIGELLIRSGRFDEAAAALRNAIILRPDRPEIPIALAGALLRAGHLDDAQRQAQAAATLAEAMPALAAEAHALGARIALARGDRDAAVEEADAAHAADAGVPMPEFVQGRLLFDKGDYDGALAAFRSAEDALPQGGTLPQLHLYAGQALTRLEQFAEAEHELREELEAFPHDLQAYSALAMLYRASDRDADIEDVVSDLVTAAPTPEGYALAARLWSTLGDRGRAEALRSDARTRFRGDPSLVLLGRDARR
jgi:arylsulfatase A-like enzyme/Flp pilus assembly protein TadD